MNLAGPEGASYSRGMILPGRLRLTTLGDLLGAVYRDGATGVLELTEASGAQAGRMHRIQVATGFVLNVETPIATPRLGAILEQQGAVSAEALRLLPGRLTRFPGKRVGALLVASGDVTRAAVDDALAEQRRERLDRLFDLEDARVAFRVARAPGSDPLEPIGPVEFLHGRERLRDRDVQPGSPSAPGVRRDPVRSRSLSTLGLGESADAVDVQRAFRQLAARLHPDRFPRASIEERRDLMLRFAEISAAYHSLVA